MLAIKNNLMAESAARQLGNSYDALSTSVERLSSGLRINSAKDDAAGLAVRELIRADIASLRQGSRNAQDGISMLQTAEGGLSQTDSILIRMRELAEQAATGTYSTEQRTVMNEEFQQLQTEITRIANNMDFNGQNMLTATGTIDIGLGKGTDSASPTEYIAVNKADMTATGLGVAGTTATFAADRMIGSATGNFVVGDNALDELEFVVTVGNVAAGTTVKTVTWVVGAATKTLAGTISELNALSRGQEAGWDMASQTYNSTTGQYGLNLSAWVAGDVTGAGAGAGAQFTVANTGATLWHADAGAGTIATADFTEVQGADSLSIGTTVGANAAIAQIDTAITTKDTYRAHLGYMMNRLESASSTIDVQAENLMAAESRISDVDVAVEMAAMTRSQVLSQAGIAMLSQANSMPQMALSLLK